MNHQPTHTSLRYDLMKEQLWQWSYRCQMLISILDVAIYADMLDQDALRQAELLRQTLCDFKKNCGEWERTSPGRRSVIRAMHKEFSILIPARLVSRLLGHPMIEIVREPR